MDITLKPQGTFHDDQFYSSVFADAETTAPEAAEILGEDEHEAETLPSDHPVEYEEQRGAAVHLCLDLWPPRARGSVYVIRRICHKTRPAHRGARQVCAQLCWRPHTTP